MKTLGQIAYEAYVAARGWRAEGEEAPTWDHLGAQTRAAWEAAANAVRAKEQE